jgi:prephenate dehydrogenase
MKTVGIVGLGLIGGSMGLDLKARGFASRVLGVEQDPLSADAAVRLGLADEIVNLDVCVAQSDIIVVAVPVGTAVKMVPEILGMIGDFSTSLEMTKSAKVVIDVCSTKEQICLATKYCPSRGRFVSTHPMAGTEYSGPWAAMPNLFDGRACIFANPEESDPSALKIIEEMYAVLNMRPIYMDAAQHDVHTAYVSHISHITSFALALTVLEKEKDEKHIFDLASGGFSSTVRLAKSNADMWVPILTQNRDNVLRVIDTYLDKMKEFRDAVAAYDESRIRELICEANKIKKIIR